jgi:hypothetical protein
LNPRAAALSRRDIDERLPMRIAIAALMALMLSALAGAAQAQPGGSYLASCWDVRMRGDTLLALCRRMDGGMQRSILPDVRSCVGDIGNQNGVLVCNRAPGAPPPGRYGRRCGELSEEYLALRDRYYRSPHPAEREQMIRRMREIDVEGARRGCPPTH